MLTDDFLKSASVLVCDDPTGSDPAFGQALEAAGITAVTSVSDPLAAQALLRDTCFDLILLDLDSAQSPALDFLAQCQHASSEAPDQPILVVIHPNAMELRHRALTLGALDFLERPFDIEALQVRICNALRIRQAQKRETHFEETLERQVQARTAELINATDAIVHRLAMVCEKADVNAATHIVRVGKMARILAKTAGLGAERCFMIERAAPLHDVGMLCVSDDILRKAGRLSEEELAHMRRHAQMGEDFLGNHPSVLVQMAASIASNHHERWDGTGYPNGLQGESIPIEGRITAICDVFDALTSKRPYKDPWSVQNAVDYLVAQAGHCFDPSLVAHFVTQLDAVEDILARYPDVH
ncbi:MAG TPA: HD domain-containing phosphohydrolase [Denitromonas sp.]|uniref:HD-GYP domain-containing protein n=1 Tax=Denitromonas sp. TaxID=2734609 RepID=UPI001DBAFF8D|nr:HD domain-containing protein [Rhodocyclaceae bacterium]MCP5220569.1 HD domain-containing protein [Zoogloeaceae bacterium]HPR05009.1 HD domain-containing phosphohydrolase [Denitromonas sp.]HQU87635.1 HD domain-containing phosphohydrolase [Denitromonas sp.]HQV13330.1 HD domain-containing phosphohydrolase [Denitromonas sp.]